MAKKTYTFKDGFLLFTAVATLIFLGLSLWVNDYQNVDVRPNDIKHIERTLHKQQDEIKLFVKNHLPYNADNTIDNDWGQLTHNKSLSLFISKNDTIVYWSDNLPINADQLKYIDTTELYTNIGNGWYVAQAIKYNEYKAVTLILIQTEYTYHNKFLKNSFNPIFGFSKNLIISPAGSDEGSLITGINGAPLFVITADIVPGQFKLSTLFGWLVVLCSLILIIALFYDWSTWKKGIHPLYILFFVLLIIRLLTLYNKSFFHEGITLFSPTLYAASGFLSSLGDLLLHLIFIFIFLVLLIRNSNGLKQNINQLSPKAFFVYRTLSTLFVGLAAWCTNYILQSLVLNSNISFEVYQISNLNGYSLVAFLAILLLLAILSLLVYLQTLFFAKHKRNKLAITQTLVFIVLIFIFIDADTLADYLLIVVFIFINLINIYWLPKSKSTLRYFALIVILYSLYTTVLLLESMNKRENQKREVWVQGLSSERDPTAEMLLREQEDKIYNDIYLRQAITVSNNPNSELLLFDRLLDLYFKGYFQNYDIQFSICTQHQPLYLRDDDRYVNCVDFFYNERELNGVPIQGSSHFWYINNPSGRIHYYGEFLFVNSKTNQIVMLFINLFSKSDSETIGYPELLLDSKAKPINSLSDIYSYAKYQNGELINQSGTYDYNLYLNKEISRNKESNFLLIFNDYSHYVHRASNSNVVIISRPEIRFIDAASLFSCSIVLLFLGLYGLFMLASYPLNINPFKLSYKRKIMYVLLASITISLTTLTITVLIFVIRQSEDKNIASIQDKLRSVMMELEKTYIPLNYKVESNKALTNTLINLSNAFYTDINLYNQSGELIASSRTEIFEKSLLGTLMNREAYVNLTMNGISKYIHWEEIGKMRYYSAYAPIYNKDNELLAYVNMPYFFKQSDFGKEITELITNIANIYILLMLLGTIFALFISSHLLRPLAKVQQKMGRLDLTQLPEKIDYRGNDEIGNLVREYNRMIGELANNAKKLAATERESAWREMARQIAHEIKNPLTPMRLSIQHVLRMKKSKAPGWEDRLDALAQSLLEQIDILSNIASEFSNFARINQRENQLIDLSIALNKSVDLFRVYDNVKFEVHEQDTEQKLIMANNDQLQRVFTNLIKNAVQAVEQKTDGTLTITLKKDDGYYIILFEDNGLGIPYDLQKRLFQPNFTTKTSGTGLGLAISKNIVESFGGQISFQPAKNGGACFIIKFPINNIGLELLRNL